jgi:hypothetical protein
MAPHDYDIILLMFIIGLKTSTNPCVTRFSGFEIDSLMALASGGGQQWRKNYRLEESFLKLSGSQSRFTFHVLKFSIDKRP